MNRMYRQGDVLIQKVDKAPRGLTEVPRDGGRVILAYGEVTGHAHAIHQTDVHLLGHADLEDRFLQVIHEGGADLVHEEHGTIHLDPGTYKVVAQKEYEPEAGSISVAD